MMAGPLSGTKDRLFETPLRIAVIAHLRHPVAEPFMGGMEAHCDLLVRTLIAGGHDVTLFASGDSAADLPLHPVSSVAYETDLPWAQWRGSERLADWLSAAYARCWAAVRQGGFDIVHNNSLFAPLHDWARRDRMAMVTSLHVPSFEMLHKAIARNAVPWLQLTVPSAKQLPAWADAGECRIQVVHNGIDLQKWDFIPCGNERAVWFGRITPNKGTVVALRAATAAGIGLDLIGPIECSDYFAEVVPLLVEGHRYLGHLSAAGLAQRVGAASVMLCTPMWDEPFGLVAAEALACGVPVAALDRGALGEVVGDCGALAANKAALPAAIHQAMVIPRERCRTRVQQLFTAEAMVERYAAAYADAMAGTDVSSIDSTRALLA